MKKIIIVDIEVFNSTLHLGAHHYAKLFKKEGWDIFWISHFINFTHFINKTNMIIISIIFKEAYKYYAKSTYCQWSFKTEPIMVVKSEPLFL